MGVVIIIALVAFFFAMNIGASGAAASMSGAYGSGALKRPVVSLLLVAIFTAVGAVTGGERVARTIGSGIVDMTDIMIDPSRGALIVLIVLGASAITLFVANALAIPLSTSEVTVGAVVGVGLVLGTVHIPTLTAIVGAWIVLPLMAFTLTSTFKTMIQRINAKFIDPTKHTSTPRWRHTLLLAVVIVSGCYNALSAGMNNVANAAGPLISAGIFHESMALWLGAVGLSLGALWLGGPVLQTTAKKLARISPGDAVIVTVAGATLVLIASSYGIPVPLTQTTAAGIIGIGWARQGRDGVDARQIKKVVKVWIFSPMASLLLTFGTVSFLLSPGHGTDYGVAAGWIAAALALLLLQTDRRIIHRRQVSR